MTKITKDTNGILSHDGNESKDSKRKLESDNIYVTIENLVLKKSSIDYIQCYGNYCKVFYSDLNRPLFLRIGLTELNELLNMDMFVKVHRSYVVNLDKVNEINANHINIANKSIPMTSKSKFKIKELMVII